MRHAARRDKASSGSSKRSTSATSLGKRRVAQRPAESSPRSDFASPAGSPPDRRQYASSPTGCADRPRSRRRGPSPLRAATAARSRVDLVLLRQRAGLVVDDGEGAVCATGRCGRRRAVSVKGGEARDHEARPCARVRLCADVGSALRSCARHQAAMRWKRGHQKAQTPGRVEDRRMLAAPSRSAVVRHTRQARADDDATKACSASCTRCRDRRRRDPASSASSAFRRRMCRA